MHVTQIVAKTINSSKAQRIQQFSVRKDNSQSSNVIERILEKYRYNNWLAVKIRLNNTFSPGSSLWVLSVTHSVAQAFVWLYKQRIKRFQHISSIKWKRPNNELETTQNSYSFNVIACFALLRHILQSIHQNLFWWSLIRKSSHNFTQARHFFILSSSVCQLHVSQSGSW